MLLSTSRFVCSSSTRYYWKIDCFFLLVSPSVSPKKQGVPEIIGPQLHLGQVLISRMASSSAITLLSNRTQYDDFTIGVHHMHCRGNMEKIQQLGAAKFTTQLYTTRTRLKWTRTHQGTRQDGWCVDGKHFCIVFLSNS
jgi:hypothetical protein